MTDREQQDRERDAAEAREQAAAERARAEQRSRDTAGTPPDVASPRQKSSGHGKVTADKWNQ